MKPKSRSHRQRLAGENRLEEERVSTPEEAVDRALNGLRHLGDQRFAVAPFYDHFDRWLLNLRTIISDFESTRTLTMDDRFAAERLQIVADIETALNERRLKESSRDETIRRANQDLIAARTALAQAEREYAAKTNEIIDRQEHAVKPVASRVANIRQELNRIVRMRTGFFRGISKRAKAKKTLETTQRLESTKGELNRIERSFVAERVKLEEEQKKRKRQLVEEITEYEKQIARLEENLQIDDALGLRHVAAEALINAINALLVRKSADSEAVNSSQ